MHLLGLPDSTRSFHNATLIWFNSASISIGNEFGSFYSFTHAANIIPTAYRRTCHRRLCQKIVTSQIVLGERDVSDGPRRTCHPERGQIFIDTATKLNSGCLKYQHEHFLCNRFNNFVSNFLIYSLPNSGDIFFLNTVI